MVIDSTEMYAAAVADFGEALVVDRVSVTGTLVLGVPQVAEEAAGVDRRRRAIVRVPTGTAVAFRSQIKRVSDGSVWHVEGVPDEEYGAIVCQCVRAKRQSEGRL